LVVGGREQRRDFPRCYKQQTNPLEDLPRRERKDNNDIRSACPLDNIPGVLKVS
jgi:hypothetical protein